MIKVTGLDGVRYDLLFLSSKLFNAPGIPKTSPRPDPRCEHYAVPRTTIRLAFRLPVTYLHERPLPRPANDPSSLTESVVEGRTRDAAAPRHG